MQTIQSGSRSAAGTTLMTLRLAACLAAMWAIFVGVAYQTYRAEWVNATLFGTNFAALIGQDIARTLEMYDLSIHALSDDASDPQVMAMEPRIRNKVLFDQSTNATGLGNLLVLDEAGKVVTDSRNLAPVGLDLSDRDYLPHSAMVPQPCSPSSACRSAGGFPTSSR